MARRKLEEILKSSATHWAQRYTILAKGLAPKHIAPHISTKSVASGEGTVTLTSSIRVVDLPNYGTMDATAQEYGYPGADIVPVKGDYLVFPWDVATVGVHRTKDGKAVLRKVHRDPMPAYNGDRGYMRPAAEAWTAEFMASSSKFKEAIRLDILDSFNKITKAGLKK